MKSLRVAADAGDSGDRTGPAQVLDERGELDAPVFAGPPKGFVQGAVRA